MTEKFPSFYYIQINLKIFIYMPDKNEISKLLEDIAGKMEYLKENPYKVGAFRKGAEAVRKSTKDVEKLIKEKKISQISGIGKSLEAVIYEFYTEGYSTLYNELSVRVPGSIEKLLKIKGLTPKKIRFLYEEAGISNIEELKTACDENRLSRFKGFDKESQEKILTQIELLNESTNMVLLSTGYRYKSLVQEELTKLKSVKRFEITDEMRRGAEVISSIQFVLLITNTKTFEKEIAEVYDTIKKDKDKYILEDKYQVSVVFHIVKAEDEFAKKLFQTTGSKEFINKLTEKGGESPSSGGTRGLGEHAGLRSGEILIGETL
ncbi:MAG: helix-hairpin-helix domain-containing protein, partial [Ignavibacteriaceae bacterium]